MLSEAWVFVKTATSSTSLALSWYQAFELGKVGSDAITVVAAECFILFVQQARAIIILASISMECIIPRFRLLDEFLLVIPCQ